MNSTIITLCCAIVLAAVSTLATELELNADNLRSVFSDFAHELSVTQTDVVGQDPRRRNLLLLGGTDFETDPFLSDFDLEVALSDFLDGVLQAPIFDFLSGLPQSQDQWEDIIKEKYNDFCSEPQKDNGASLLQSCVGPEITLELVPGVCEVVNKDHNQFDCQPPRLEYRRTGPVCTNSFREPAQFIDKECKFVQQIGVEKEIILGGGSMDTLLKFGKQNIEINPEFDFTEFTDVISGLFSDLTDFPDISDLPIL